MLNTERKVPTFSCVLPEVVSWLGAGLSLGLNLGELSAHIGGNAAYED